MADISGISDFLQQAGTHFKIFDMGRRIQELDADTFLAFEQGKTPYPYPLQQQAWLGMLVWDTDKDSELVIWFLRFPLDAKGCLTQGIRDDFVYRLLNKDDQQADDENNPYGFKPKQEHMACFHAKAARILNQPASQFYSHARDYFGGEPGFEQWAFVGFQGIADVAARLDEDDNLERLIRALPDLPNQPFDALCQCLEHETIPEALSQAVVDVLDRELASSTPNANTLSLCLRALSASSNQAVCAQQVQKVLNSPQGTDAEVIASISGRCWTTLQQEALLLSFLEQLAQCPQGQEFFNLVIVDLINIPGMQDPIYAAIRHPERSDRLSRAIGELFQHFTS